MTKLYFVRHCEAQGNLKRLFQGSSNFDISETGAVQLEFLKERFKDIKLDAVYTSPLMRAEKTALAVIGDKDMQPIRHEGLREICGGVIEGKPFLESMTLLPDLADAWNNHPQDFEPEGGEPMSKAYERIWEAVLDIVRQNPGKTVAAATHGGVTRCLMCRLIFNDITRLKDVDWCENTAVSLIEFDDALNPTLIYMNDRSHVPDEYMPKRSRIISFAGDKK